MKINLKRLLNFLFIAATFALIIIVAFSNNEMTDAWNTLFTLDPKWLLGALAGWLCYLLFDALSLHYSLSKQGYRLPLRQIVYVSLIGFYYSNITPGASGGQPMQIYYLNKREVPVGIGTSAITIRLFCMQFMVVLIAVILWLINREALSTQIAGVEWIILVGGIINFAAVPLILLVGLYRPPVQALVNFGIRIGAKMRLIKNPESTSLRVNATLDTYHASILQVSKNPRQILVQLLLMGVSMLGLFSVTVSVYYAFRLSGTPWHHILTISSFLFLSTSYTPLPGASGAQEGGFLLFYKGIFTSGTIGLALLVWRFFTYYLFLIVGALLTLITNLRPKRKQKAALRKAEEDATEQS